MAERGPSDIVLVRQSWSGAKGSSDSDGELVDEVGKQITSTSSSASEATSLLGFLKLSSHRVPSVSVVLGVKLCRPGLGGPTSH